MNDDNVKYTGMSDNEFWIKIFRMIMTALCVILIASLTSCQTSKYQLRKMTEATGSGIESACAIQMIVDGGLRSAGPALLCTQYQTNQEK